MIDVTTNKMTRTTIDAPVTPKRGGSNDRLVNFRLGTSRVGETLSVTMRNADTMWKSSRRSRPLTINVVRAKTKMIKSFGSRSVPSILIGLECKTNC